MHSGDFEFTASANDSDRRIDTVLRRILPDTPLSALHRNLRTGKVLINGRKATGKQRLARGDRITFSKQLAGTSTPQIADDLRGILAEQGTKTPAPPHFNPQYGNILYENTQIIAINKRRGSSLFGPDSCQSEIRKYCALQAQQAGTTAPRWGLVFQPSAVHRLDKNTSGVLMFSAHVDGARHFRELQIAGGLCKSYIALFQGTIRKPTTWTRPLARDTQRKITVPEPLATKQGLSSRAAKTSVKPLLHGDNVTLALCTITAGFTHQIRAHALAYGHQLVGDKKYRGYRGHGGYLLHCYKIHITQRQGAHKHPGANLFPPITAPLFPESAAYLLRYFTRQQLVHMDKLLPSLGAAAKN